MPDEQRVLLQAAGRDLENGPENRIQEFSVQGQPIKADHVYTAAFVTEQGVPQNYGTDRQQHVIHTIDALQAYLSDRGVV
jgi:S-sulfosulfanyl-L-cysteine sulfohydrolase